ncbi:MAG: pyrimidine dimer DNA glycosylase/endonuclease V [Desulfuromonadales bacterium]
MRLWSLHPRCLDAKGLVALWREGLLARKVLSGQTKGYRCHPQLIRFREQTHPVDAIDAYLGTVCDEADKRGYHFDRAKITPQSCFLLPLPVTNGQLHFEWEHLLQKLLKRDHDRFEMLRMSVEPEPHPLFIVVAGDVELWEKYIRKK